MSERQTMRAVMVFLIAATLLSILVFLLFPSFALYCFGGFQPRDAIITAAALWIVVWAVTLVILRSRRKG